jgi:phage gp45-like
MMMAVRTTLKDTGRRSQTSMSRGTLRKLDSKPYWSEVDIDVMASETHTGVEFVENYGSTMVPAKQDEEEEGQKQPKQQQASSGGDGEAGGGGAGSDPEFGEQPKGDAAEPIVMYLNGSRSHPVVVAMGDRRHRLLELEEGDVANHRLKDDRQQVLLSKDGTYVSTRDDKIFRTALVPKETKDDAQQAQAPARGGGGQQQQGKKQKTYGQKSAKDDNKKSQVALEQNGKETFSQHGQFYSSVRGGSDSSTYHQDRKHSAQATDEHVHVRFNDNRIWVDKDGHWSELPILQKKDKHCKE